MKLQWSNATVCSFQEAAVGLIGSVLTKQKQENNLKEETTGTAAAVRLQGFKDKMLLYGSFFFSDLLVQHSEAVTITEPAVFKNSSNTASRGVAGEGRWDWIPEHLNAAPAGLDFTLLGLFLVHLHVSQAAGDVFRFCEWAIMVPNKLHYPRCIGGRFHPKYKEL